MTMFNQTEPEFWPFLIRFLPSQVFCLEAESMTRLLFVYVSIQMEPKFCCFLAIFPLSAPSCRHWPLFWYFSSFILGDESRARLLLVYMSIQMEPEFCCLTAILPLSAPSCHHWPLFWYFLSFILGDESMTMLTQELLVYMSMFIQTEPELFHGMLRYHPFTT